MRNLFQLIAKYHFFLLFVVLCSFSVYLVGKYNNYQKAQMTALTRNFSGNFFKWLSGYKEYISLKEINYQLLIENAGLRNDLRTSGFENAPKLSVALDSLHTKHFNYIPATVVNNSTNKQYNYITLNKGSNQGIKPEMGVISNQGVVGIVRDVSPNFSMVIPVLNRNLKLSAKFKKNNYFGSLEWPGVNYRTANLVDIPHHVKIEKGDTIVTTGYSSVFPEGIIIGYVNEFALEGGSFYSIKVRLSTDFKNLFFVYVVDNVFQNEQRKAEMEAVND